MKDIRFNYCIPREYKKDGKTLYAICNGGDLMSVDSIINIQKLADVSKPKDSQPWLQVFNSGYRVTNSNIDWKYWNGITFSDVDTKLFYNDVQQFDVNRLLNIIYENIQFRYNYNFFCCYISPGGLSYRILYYWECDRTEENFMKCALLTEQYTRDLFYSFGTQGKQMIDYSRGRSKVLDSCSKSSKQGLYVSDKKILFSEFTDDKHFGHCVLDDIKIADLYRLNVQNTLGGDKQMINVKFENKTHIEKNNVNYYPHHYRRCIYEALMVLFSKDKNKVDEEWKYIASLIPTSDGMGGGHDTAFYINEPDKNHWFERFNDNVNHSLHWLKEFGYEFSDKSEYVYFDQFRKSWRKHIKTIVISKLINARHKDRNKSEKEELMSKYFNETNIFNKIYDDIEDIDEYRSSYYKTRFKREDFKYLLDGYVIAKDSVTYKMYADFYYRDEYNLPTIKYNILEDDILIYGYDTKEQKVHWHTLKTNDEYTHWCNNDEFSNNATKEKMRDALRKYVSKWFGYHSLREYLNGLDLSKANEDLLETWAIRYFKADDTSLTRQISKKFFIAAVKKMLIDDPTKFVFQHMLFLQGPTGCGKTFFLVNMFTIDGKQYFLNDIKPDDADKDIGPVIEKNWMIHFGESKSLTKADVNSVKEFVDRVNLAMKYQKKYENEQTTIYPRIVICRTSNDQTLFNDVSISEVDRRNWLIVCNTEAMSCDDELKRTIKEERDILWATALKLYLDNPEQDLELDNIGDRLLAEVQEDFKMIKNDEIKEIYDEIFERKYIVNSKGFIRDEYDFTKMLERSDSVLEGVSTEDAAFLNSMKLISGTNDCLEKIIRLPSSWVKSFVIKKYGVNTMKLLKKHLKNNGWTLKNAGYNDKILKCWCR